MRLFHVSEDENILVFYPRTPKRKDLNPKEGLVWAIDEQRLPNFLTPRNCPRVTWYAGADTSSEDKKKYFSSTTGSHVVVIENKWFEAMKNTVLYLYEFNPAGFELQDKIAGYYISKTTQIPIGKTRIENVFAELFLRGVEVRIVDNLWDICERVQKSTLNWSMCRMGFAQEKK